MSYIIYFVLCLGRQTLLVNHLAGYISMSTYYMPGRMESSEHNSKKADMSLNIREYFLLHQTLSG